MGPHWGSRKTNSERITVALFQPQGSCRVTSENPEHNGSPKCNAALGLGTLTNRGHPNGPSALLPTHPMATYPVASQPKAPIPRVSSSAFGPDGKLTGLVGGDRSPVFKRSLPTSSIVIQTSLSKGQCVCWVKTAKGGPLHREQVLLTCPLQGPVTPSACLGGQQQPES